MRSRIIQIALKGVGKFKLCLEEFWLFSAFVMLKKTFSKYKLIKISTACVYIKAEVKKNDITRMTAVINGACIGWLHANCYLMGRGMTLLMEEDVNLSAGIFLVRIFRGFFIPKVSYKGSGEVEAVHTYWGQQSKIKGEGILGQIKGVVNFGRQSCWTVFCIRGLVSRSFRYDCETKNAHRRQKFW